VTTTEEHIMSNEYDDPRADEAYDAYIEAQHEKWADTATECGNCGELWQPGEHRATRTDPGYYEQPDCPACGEWSIGDPSPERDDDGAPAKPVDLPVTTQDFIDASVNPDAPEQEPPF
jgi:hypothetical protein